MTTTDKTWARMLFKTKILDATGQAFEDLFTRIMGYSEPGFQQVKPQGSIGDRKNDGYVKANGRYFQVYAPENPTASLGDAIRKLEDDFAGLCQHWAPIGEYFFVFNDKYHGAYPTLLDAIEAIKARHHLNAAGILAANALENRLFSLADDQIYAIVGFPPSGPIDSRLNFGVLAEVIEHIMSRPLPTLGQGRLIAPKWDEKIQFNGLSVVVADYLNQGFYQLGDLDEYLNRNGEFLKTEIQARLIAAYTETVARPEYSGVSNADVAFMHILDEICPRRESQFQRPALVLMSKYFASCDIFVEPPSC